MTDEKFYDPFATDQDTQNEARSVLRNLFSSFSKKQKKSLSSLREIEDFPLRCERLRKFFREAIGNQILKLNTGGSCYSVRYAAGGLCVISDEWTEWLGYSDVAVTLATADLTASVKSRSAEAAPKKKGEVPSVPEFDFSDFFDDWDSFTTSDSAAKEENQPDVIISEVSFPEPVSEEPQKIGNFYTDASALYIPTSREDKIAKNIEAIRCLKEIENKERELTVEAQEILSRYSGWGGAAGVFDENYDGFSVQREELKNLLAKTEYESAKASTVSAFYTEPWMISLIYKTLQRFGFHGGTLLEPAMGIGNFFRFLPEEMRKSRLYGVELDSVTGRIAKLLYPDAKIVLGGFETADYQCPNSYFDVIVENCPFGSWRVLDSEFGARWLIHDFFFAKSLSKLRPGGIMAVIVSKGSLDKEDDSLRKYMAEHATFLGAIRLPSKAFVGYGGADVTTDIVFFKKEACDAVQPFVSVVPAFDPEFGLSNLMMNEYYVAHPEMMIGKMKAEKGRFGVDSLTTTCSFDGTREEMIALANEAALKIEATYEETEDTLAEEGESAERVMYDPEMGVRNYTFTFIEGDLYYREDNFLYLRKLNSTAQKRVMHCCKVRDALRNLLQMQADGCSDEQFEAGARELNRVYDTAIAKIGYLSNRANSLAFRDDADYPLICSLENIDPNDEDHVTKSEIFTERSVRPNLILMPVETAEDAIRCSLAESGKLNPAVLRSIYNPYGEEVCGAAYMDKLAEEVPDLLYRDPDQNGFWVPADEYLSGNVRMKLQTAKLAEEKEPGKYSRNIAALQSILPLKLPLSEVTIQIGTPWITDADYTKFCHEVLMKSRPYYWSDVEVFYSKPLGCYEITDMKYLGGTRETGRFGFGVLHKDGGEIFRDALNGKPIAVYRTDYDGKRVLEAEETMLARQKLDEMNKAFREWLTSDVERVMYYEDYYNLYYNGTVLRRYNGSSLTLPGINPSIKLRTYQKDAIARGLTGNTLFAHEVGAGKTYTMVATIMEKRRLGLAKKPLLVVPKSLLLQTASEFLRLYPSANIIVASDRDFEKTRRRRFVARLATSSGFDCAICSYEQFVKIPVSKELQEKRIQSEIDALEASVYELADSGRGGRNGRILKRLETLKKNLRASLMELQTVRDEDFLNFECCGFDMVVVDEAHNMKNLHFVTCLSCVNVAKSKRAEDLKMKVDYLNEKYSYKAVYFATGTPIANSLAELYIMTSYLRDDLLKERGIDVFDRWAANFAQVKTELELSVANQWQLKDRLSAFTNIPELAMIFHSFTDILTADDLDTVIERPKIHGGRHIVTECYMDDFAEELNAEFLERAERIHEGHVDPREDNFLKIANDAKKLACDNRLMQVTDDNGKEIVPPYNPDGKIAHLVDNVVTEYHRFDSVHFPSTQVIFLDMGTPDGSQFNLYADIKTRLVNAGIPESEIVFVHDAKTDQQRAALFRAVDAAKYRVLIGSSSKCGQGANFQTYLSSCHVICPPWRCCDLDQMCGRIVRYGNRTPGGEVFIYEYVQKSRGASVGSFDSFNWSILQRKANFISSIMQNKDLSRTAEDISETAYNYGLIKMIALGDSSVKKRMECEIEVQRLKLARSQWDKNRQELLRDYQVDLPDKIRKLNSKIKQIEADTALVATLSDVSKWELVIDDATVYHGAEEIGAYLAERIDKLPFRDIEGEFLGKIGAFTLMATRTILPESGHSVSQMIVVGEYTYTADLMRRADTIIGRIAKVFEDIPDRLERTKADLVATETAMVSAKEQYDAPFEYEADLVRAKERLAELTEALLKEQHSI